MAPGRRKEENTQASDLLPALCFSALGLLSCGAASEALGKATWLLPRQNGLAEDIREENVRMDFLWVPLPDLHP